ncbi:hypothetical protein NG800_011490 [Epilithonimonas ginsengisoli]|uniref:Uncharacterized protein n=1 Tax=Epilithonimonas ginsengisoli TaxID=1245592 RepID=A0ABU4JIL5_9FLAO|nr:MULTISPECIES: hypothetical protein [Chryseobacterium group]MBV6879103.1 hypothetical protein [Epilithonimonas sp. FP105]MDW8549537.1 hypothetical protein [Epilithonimonas ginsengisoli]
MDFVLIEMFWKWTKLKLWRSCVRDGSGNPFCLCGSVFLRPMVKDKKIATDSPTRAAGKFGEGYAQILMNDE